MRNLSFANSRWSVTFVGFDTRTVVFVLRVTLTLYEWYEWSVHQALSMCVLY